jgi:hypothetical protein
MRIFLTNDLCATINQLYMIFFFFYNKGSYLMMMISLSRLLSESGFFNFLCVYLLLKKYILEKILALFSEKNMFFLKKYFSEVVKNLKISCYLLIISSLILKFFIVIYIYI